MNVYVDILEFREDLKFYTNQLIRQAYEAKQQGHNSFNIVIRVTPNFQKELYHNICFFELLGHLYDWKILLSQLPENLEKELYFHNC